MEFIVEQALQKGIEAQKAGKAQEADRYYTSILKTNPRHPDANHNMGILALGLGKVEVALLFLKTALDVNANIAQYWLSYIGALIKLDRIADAKEVFNQAKSNGVQGDDFDQIERQLNNFSAEFKNNAKENIPTQPNILDKLKLDKALKLAENKVKDGLSKEAKKIYHDILKKFPKNKKSLNGIKMLAGKTLATNPNIKEPSKEKLASLLTLYNQQKLQQVFNEAKTLTKLYTKSLTLWNLMGASAAQIGKLDEAVLAFKEALLIKPEYAEAYNNIGNVFKNQGKLEEAIEAYDKALTIKPDYAEAYNNMANALIEQEKLEEALGAYNKALTIKPNYVEAHLNMGNVLKDQEKLEEAIKAYDKALTIKPDYAEAYNNKGIILKSQEKLGGAIEAYKKALSLKPDYAEAYYGMGNVLKDQEKLEEAIEAYNKALTIKPDYAEAHNNKGITLKEQQKLEEAIEAYSKAISLNPNRAETYLNMGSALQDQGRLEEAIEAYTKALSLKPDNAHAHRSLSAIKQYTVEDEHFLQVQEIYKCERLSDDQRCNFNFTLAKMYEDVGKLEQAFSHLVAGNALRKKMLKYSIDQDIEVFTRLRETQPHLSKNSLKIKESSIGSTPIFILGMPRSGTTLVEQIISSHSEVFGAGELKYVAQFGQKLSVDLTSINIAAIAEFRQRYLSELSKLSHGRHFVTDKMPHNFRFIPLICAAFPNAKIIHVQRNAAATCWSNYTKYFTTEGLGYCYDLKDVVSYYELYIELMEFWQSEYSDKIYNLNYEKLTTDQESETRSVINHLGLNWEEACLSPNKNKRIVSTASQQQVKQKVYQGSSEAWRKYEPYLNGTFNSLVSL